MQYKVKKAEKNNCYDIIGVSKTASTAQIRQAYHKLALSCHPDRDMGNDRDFLCISEAYRLLKDPCKRKLYDIAIDITPPCLRQVEYEKVASIELETARNEVELMDQTFMNKLSREEKIEGLIILKAMYGDLKGKNYINVEIPLQCLVESSQLFISADIPKKTLGGFYDVCPNRLDVEKRLYVFYMYGGCLHEVEIGEEDFLLLPMREHRLQIEKERKQTTTPNFHSFHYNKMMQERARVKRFITGAFITGIIAYLVQRNTKVLTNLWKMQ